MEGECGSQEPVNVVAWTLTAVMHTAVIKSGRTRNVKVYRMYLSKENNAYTAHV